MLYIDTVSSSLYALKSGSLCFRVCNQEQNTFESISFSGETEVLVAAIASCHIIPENNIFIKGIFLLFEWTCS